MGRFRLEKSKDQPGWWGLTDTVNLIVFKFEEHRFNETQRITILEDSLFVHDPDCTNKLAHAMMEAADYMATHWYSIAMPTPVFEFRKDDENDRMLVIRNKFPRFTLEIQDECNCDQIGKALKKCGEYVRKYRREKNG